MSSVAAVVLAAGAATRFGSPKQLLLLPSVLEHLGASAVGEVVVVEGAYAIGNDLLHGAARLVRCHDWELGPGASLRCGLAALGDGVDAAVVVLADGPDLAPEAVSRVIEDWRELGGELVAASYGGARGHPLLIARGAWQTIPDEGLRGAGPRLVACDDLGSPGDIDRPEDLEARGH